MMKEIIVNKRYHEKKLNKVILERVPNINYPTFCKLLRKKDIKINGRRINKDMLVYENDKIEIYLPKELEETKINLDKVYEDENILVINKPAKIEVTGLNSLTEIINKQYTNCEFKPQPCHRIDRNTTGLVLFAKNKVKKLAIVYVLMAFVNIVLAISFAPKFGAMGVCMSIFFAYLVRTIGMDIIFYKDLHINVMLFFKKTFAALLIPMILCLILGFAINTIIRLDSWLGFIIKGICFVGSYTAIMYLFAMNNSEKELVLTPIKKVCRKL